MNYLNIWLCFITIKHLQHISETFQMPVLLFWCLSHFCKLHSAVQTVQQPWPWPHTARDGFPMCNQGSEILTFSKAGSTRTKSPTVDSLLYLWAGVWPRSSENLLSPFLDILSAVSGKKENRSKQADFLPLWCIWCLLNSVPEEVKCSQHTRSSPKNENVAYQHPYVPTGIDRPVTMVLIKLDVAVCCVRCLVPCQVSNYGVPCRWRKINRDITESKMKDC